MKSVHTPRIRFMQHPKIKPHHLQRPSLHLAPFPLLGGLLFFHPLELPKLPLQCTVKPLPSLLNRAAFVLQRTTLLHPVFALPTTRKCHLRVKTSIVNCKLFERQAREERRGLHLPTRNLARLRSSLGCSLNHPAVQLTRTRACCGE